MEQLRYPIGKFGVKRPISLAQTQQFIEDIAALPTQLRQAVAHLSDEQLDTPYRPGGWSLRQVVHHLADSHINSITRFKLALTEQKPVIKPYYEDRWANLPDASAPIDLSLNLLDGLHQRWTILLRSLSEEDLDKTFIHPEHGKEVPLDINIALYSWHGRHHLAQIIALKDRMNWT
ncbi:MAG: YfiT family bacillithiol transferase [Bacteroidota bacterium]